MLWTFFTLLQQGIPRLDFHNVDISSIGIFCSQTFPIVLKKGIIGKVRTHLGSDFSCSDFSNSPIEEGFKKTFYSWNFFLIFSKRRSSADRFLLTRKSQQVYFYLLLCSDEGSSVRRFVGSSVRRNVGYSDHQWIGSSAFSWAELFSDYRPSWPLRH